MSLGQFLSATEGPLSRLFRKAPESLRVDSGRIAEKDRVRVVNESNSVLLSGKTRRMKHALHAYHRENRCYPSPEELQQFMDLSRNGPQIVDLEPLSHLGGLKTAINDCSDLDPLPPEFGGYAEIELSRAFLVRVETRDFRAFVATPTRSD